MALTPTQLQQWEEDGYLLLPSFFTASETSELLSRTEELLASFDPTTHPLTRFTTAADDDAHVGDEYFLTSGDKIRFFLEPGAVTPATATEAAKLNVRADRSVNKIGHALLLDPVFGKYTLSERVKDVAKALGAHKSPRVLQSMVICKQPRIGGQGGCRVGQLCREKIADTQCRVITTRHSCIPTLPVLLGAGLRWRTARPRMAVS